MPSIASQIEHIPKSEGGLVLVTLGLMLASAALLVGERFQIFDFAGLPTWTRPSGEILSVVSACYLVVRVFWAVLIALARARRGLDTHSVCAWPDDSLTVQGKATELINGIKSKSWGPKSSSKN